MLTKCYSYCNSNNILNSYIFNCSIDMPWPHCTLGTLWYWTLNFEFKNTVMAYSFYHGFIFHMYKLSNFNFFKMLINTTVSFHWQLVMMVHIYCLFIRPTKIWAGRTKKSVLLLLSDAIFCSMNYDLPWVTRWML